MKNNIKKQKEIEELLIKVGIEIAKKGEGALFVICNNCKYTKLLKQKIQPFSIFEKGAIKTLLSIGMIDGAVIIDSKGVVQEYGAMIKSKKVFHGFGTRHAAAYNASLDKNAVAILVSQEERKVKIFKNGKVVIQFDALEKNIEKKVSEASHVLESVGFGTFSAIGVAALAPTLGIAIVPGIILFGAPYYIFKRIKERTEKDSKK